jgi:hypothetical protein
MVQRRRGARLGTKSPPSFLVRERLGGQCLDRNRAAKARIVCTIDLPMPSAPIADRISYRRM